MKPSLARDRDGAVMVMGVFMAVLMVAFVYYVKGIGDAIVFRERMQDAADAGAFAAAATHARGMNLVALINITTIGVLAVVSALRLINKFIAPTAAVLAALSAPGQVPGIKAAGNHAGARYDQLQRPLRSILRAGNTAANAVARAIPEAARARAAGAAVIGFQPAVDQVGVEDSFNALPVEDATVDELLARAGAPAVSLAAVAFRPFSVATGFIAGRPPGELAARTVVLARGVLTDGGRDPDSIFGMVPQHLSDSAVLGGERLQLRVAVGGTFDFGLSDRGVALASWGQDEGDDAAREALAALSNIALAQAEYYYAGPGGRDEWLWNQRWQARLRRLRLTSDGTCADTSIACDAIGTIVERGLDRAVVH
jgi:hypothetical protein